VLLQLLHRFRYRILDHRRDRQPVSQVPNRISQSLKKRPFDANAERYLCQGSVSRGKSVREETGAYKTRWEGPPAPSGRLLATETIVHRIAKANTQAIYIHERILHKYASIALRVLQLQPTVQVAAPIPTRSTPEKRGANVRSRLPVLQIHSHVFRHSGRQTNNLRPMPSNDCFAAFTGKS